MFWDYARKAGLFVVIILFAFVVSFLLVSLNGLATNAALPIEPKNLGQGIYSLEVNLNSDTESEMLKKSLVKFHQDHPNLRIIAILPSKQNPYGIIKEVLIITEPK